MRPFVSLKSEIPIVVTLASFQHYVSQTNGNIAYYQMMIPFELLAALSALIAEYIRMNGILVGFQYVRRFE